MPRFNLGDQVVTPKHGAGEIIMVHGNKVNDRHFYSVSVAPVRHAVICHEPELRLVPGQAPGDVRCADCTQHRASHVIPGTCRCTVDGRPKAIDILRTCSTFKRRT